MSDSETVETKKKGRSGAVEKRANTTVAPEKEEVPAKRGRGRPKGTNKKNHETPKKAPVTKKRTSSKGGRGRPAKKKADSTEDDTEDNLTENNESDE